MTSTKLTPTLSAHSSQTVLRAIEEANRAVVAAVHAVAATDDPVAPFLLGLSADALAELKDIRPSALVRAAGKSGLSLFSFRFADAATIRLIRDKGFSDDVILRELCKQLPDHLQKK